MGVGLQYIKITVLRAVFLHITRREATTNVVDEGDESFPQRHRSPRLFRCPEPELDESTRAQLGGTYVNLSPGTVHYELVGPTDGGIVVLVHGGTVPMWAWDSQVAALTEAVISSLVHCLPSSPRI